VNDNRIILRNGSIDSGFRYGLYGNLGGIWDVEDATISADTPFRLRSLVSNGRQYLWDVVIQNITPPNYTIEYGNQEPFISNGVSPPLKISSPTSGTSVDGSTIISYYGDNPQTPQCSVDGGAWTGCASGQATLNLLPGWKNINVGTTFSLYLRDLTSDGEWGTDVVAGLKKLAD
jgi:hypothetical protein